MRSRAMKQGRTDSIDAIFRSVASLSRPNRAACRAQICAGDAELLAEVQTLLQQGEETQTIQLFDKPPDQTVQSGEILAGRFRIVRLVGKGGMVEVYQAEDRDLKSTVALKVMRPEYSNDPDVFDRFRREVQIARQVTHANVCRVYDVGYDHQGDRRRVFLTMEFLNGETLEQRLRRTGPITANVALPLIQQMATGLAALHEQGIVHRDFKPGNVLIVKAASGSERVVIS